MSQNEIVLKPSEVFIIKLGDSSYELKKPTARLLSEFQSRLAKVKDNHSKTLDELVSFLVSLGLEKTFCDDLDIDQLGQIVEALTGSKKK